MDSYTITIAPNDDSGNSTTLVVDTSGDQIRITDVHLHAAGGLSNGTMPTVDFGLLLRAVGTASTGRPRVEPAPAPVPPQVGTVESADRAETSAVTVEEPAPAEARSPRTRRATAAPVADPKRSRPRRGRAANTAAPEDAAAGTRRRRTAAAPTKAAATKKAAKRATAQKPGGGRAYRRMPEDLSAVYAQTSSPAAIADHYGVPRHTAQGWIRRIKNHK
jgi:hypothetical protein